MKNPVVGKPAKIWGLGVMVLLNLAGPGASAQTAYSITDLGEGTAYGINNSGQVVGQNAAGDAFMYNNGSVTDLGGGCAYGINGNGQVVGVLPAPATPFFTATGR